MPTRVPWAVASASLLLLFRNLTGGATFLVTNTNSSGPGSFIAALADANATGGPNQVLFGNVSGTIVPSSSSSTLTASDVSIIGPGAHTLAISGIRIKIPSGATSTISGLHFEFGYSGDYGGIIQNDGTLFLKEVELTQGSALFGGGAIVNSGTLQISDCSIYDNSALGMYGTYPPPGYCRGGVGGAIYLLGGSLRMTNSTLSANQCGPSSVGAFCTGQSGGIGGACSDILLVNCTLANSTRETCFNGINCIVLGWGTEQAIVDANHNLIGADSAAAALGPLQDNGGPTLTHALLDGSLAFEAGTSNGAPPTDQRGIIRPQGRSVDIGAFEVEWPVGGFVSLSLNTVGSGTIFHDITSSRYPSNTIVKLSAVPGEDFRFTGWSGALSGTNNPESLLLNGDKAVTATFASSPMTVVSPPGSTNYVTNTNAFGLGSLRQAIRNANASGGGVIHFSNAIGVISGLMPNITASTTIIGPGSRVLTLMPTNPSTAWGFSAGTTSRISGISLSSFTLTNSGGLALNGCMLPDTQLHNNGDLDINSSVLTGGEIFSYAAGTGRVRRTTIARANPIRMYAGILQMEDSLLTGNRFSTNGGAVWMTSGLLHLMRCRIATNFAFDTSVSSGLVPGSSGLGGGIYFGGGLLEATDCSFEGNSARGQSGTSDFPHQIATDGGSGLGGAIYVGGGTVRITNCAFLGNSALGGNAPSATRNAAFGGSGDGAGILVSTGDVVVVNCTFSSNSVAGGYGSGCSFLGGCGYGGGGAGAGFGNYFGTCSLVNCTITKNLLALTGTSPAEPRGIASGLFNGQGTVRLLNTIIAGNLGTNDAYGIFASQGHNIFGITNGVVGLDPTDLVGIDPKLGPLQDNGGPTLTHALLAGSPAIDGGASSFVSFDQRGEPRPVDDPAVPNGVGGDASDIGAFEVNPFLRCTGVERHGNDIVVKVTSVSDGAYGIQYRTNAESGTWITLPGYVAGSGGIISIIETNAGSLLQRVYRVRKQ